MACDAGPSCPPSSWPLIQDFPHGGWRMVAVDRVDRSRNRVRAIASAYDEGGLRISGATLGAGAGGYRFRRSSGRSIECTVSSTKITTDTHLDEIIVRARGTRVLGLTQFAMWTSMLPPALACSYLHIHSP